MKKYLEVKNQTKDVNALRVEVYYSKGCYNLWTYKEEKRGYYVSVMPVRRDGFMESYTAFTGVKQLIKEVQRKSEKAYNSALQSAGGIINNLIDYVCKENNIEVLQDEKDSIL
jgi:hypothetical protein